MQSRAATDLLSTRQGAAGPARARLPSAATEADSAVTAALRAEAEAALVSLKASGAALHGLALHDVSRFGAWPMTTWRLGNGLRIVLLPDPGAKLVAYHTWLGVGSADEAAGKTGAAHLLEHLMFKASARFPAGTFDRVLERMGSSPNAATWLDWTMYHQTIVPEAIAEVAQMEADRLGHLALTPAAFAAELEVVRAERREAVDNDPEGKLEELYARCMWGGEVGYGHPTLGSGADLRGLTLDEVKAFYARWYVPSNAVVVLTGAVDPGRDLGLLVSAYGPLDGAREALPARAAVAALTPIRRAVRVDLATDRLIVGWRAPPGDALDQPAVAMLAEVLGNADSSRLDRALVDDGRLASSVDVDALGLARAGALEIRVTLRPGRRADRALEAIDREIAALLGDRKVLASELAAARNRLQMARYASLDGVDGRAEVVGAAAVSFGDPRVAERWWQRLLVVSVADIQRVAAELLRDDQRVVVIGSARSAGARVRRR